MLPLLLALRLPLLMGLNSTDPDDVGFRDRRLVKDKMDPMERLIRLEERRLLLRFLCERSDRRFALTSSLVVGLSIEASSDALR